MKKADWQVLKSGARRNGDWYIFHYPRGFYLYGGKPYRSFGPFDTIGGATKKHESLKV